MLHATQVEVIKLLELWDTLKYFVNQVVYASEVSDKHPSIYIDVHYDSFNVECSHAWTDSLWHLHNKKKQDWPFVFFDFSSNVLVQSQNNVNVSLCTVRLHCMYLKWWVLSQPRKTDFPALCQLSVSVLLWCSAIKQASTARVWQHELPTLVSKSKFVKEKVKVRVGMFCVNQVSWCSFSHYSTAGENESQISLSVSLNKGLWETII